MPFVRPDDHGAGTLEPIFFAQLAVSVLGALVAMERWSLALPIAGVFAAGVFSLLTAMLFHTRTRRLSALLGTATGTAYCAFWGWGLLHARVAGAALGGALGLLVMLACYRRLLSSSWRPQV